MTLLLEYDITTFLGGTQIRTGDIGFAILCLTTWLYRPFFAINTCVYSILADFPIPLQDSKSFHYC